MVTSWELGLVNLGVCLAAICTISVLDAFLVSKRTEENSDSGEFHGIWEDIHAEAAAAQRGQGNASVRGWTTGRARGVGRSGGCGRNWNWNSI